MNFQSSVSKDLAGGVRIAEGQVPGEGWVALDREQTAPKAEAADARRVSSGDDLSVGTQSTPAWGWPGAGQGASVPATGHRPGRRVPDADIVHVGRRPADPPSEATRAFRRKLVGLAFVGLLMMGAGLHYVRVNNLLGWTPITIGEVVPQHV